MDKIHVTCVLLMFEFAMHVDIDICVFSQEIIIPLLGLVLVLELLQSCVLLTL